MKFRFEPGNKQVIRAFVKVGRTNYQTWFSNGTWAAWEELVHKYRPIDATLREAQDMGRIVEQTVDHGGLAIIATGNPERGQTEHGLECVCIPGTETWIQAKYWNAVKNLTLNVRPYKTDDPVWVSAQNGQWGLKGGTPVAIIMPVQSIGIVRIAA